MQKLLCQKVNCIARTLFGIVFALPVSGCTVLGKSLNQFECPLLFLQLPLMPFSFSFSLSLKSWCFIEVCLYTSFLLNLSILKFSLVDFTHSFCFCSSLPDKNPCLSADVVKYVHSLAQSTPLRNFAILIKDWAAGMNKPGCYLHKLHGKDGSWRFEM